MAFIRIVDEDAAEGRLAELYAGLVEPSSGRVDEVLRIHSLNPRGLDAHLAIYRAAMASTRGLRKVDRELIALVVSTINGCHY